MAAICAIDDDASTLRLIEFALKQEGHAVHCANTRVVAEKMLKDSAFSLIILDLNMPDTSGIALLKAIRSGPRSKHTPVLMLTGESSPAVAEQCRAMGANGYLVKPIRRDMFIKRVEEILDCYRGTSRASA